MESDLSDVPLSKPWPPVFSPGLYWLLCANVLRPGSCDAKSFCLATMQKLQGLGECWKARPLGSNFCFEPWALLVWNPYVRLCLVPPVLNTRLCRKSKVCKIDGVQALWINALWQVGFLASSPMCKRDPVLSHAHGLLLLFFVREKISDFCPR